MPEHENNKHTLRQEEQREEQKRADVPGDLAANILAHLGLLKDASARASGSVPDWQKQVIAVQKLAAICNESNVRQIVRALEQDLGHRHTAVRMAVVRTLGKISLAFPGHVRWELFMRGLADQSPEVRATTVQVFITFVTAPQARPPHTQAIARLAKRLCQLRPDGRAGEDDTVNISIIQLMGLLGDLAPDTAVAAIASLACNRNENWPVREAALLVLGSLYARLSAPQRQQVNGMLYDPHPFVRQVAIGALHGRVAVATVLQVLRTGRQREQVCAAQVLAHWGERHVLGRLALDQDAASSVRAAALLGLAQLAQTQDLVIKTTELKGLLGERDFSIRAAAEILKEVRETRRLAADEAEGVG